ncbi:type IV toxin-antitoxin system AbiEi family antitoxin domain-containing protein [Klenkia sp. PcliD-1-E]|uniref:type IV toxin-antitoxin system AbiEi family antitoxin domain-containing protein n=1 Tax=Klenkia sp. PcliD-1-E TaxID=2954492 RepID=UPI0020976509|nr:type IV toxin-antitoxin system AbiEi family antitoxin domain-containing protein [Klenkia sp. PcliD-1-E]MCO7220195.1 type IV toxin-antitoxin system AbiEi family antitoxin domain-containing protein [Klenkia sp. PcliD-1-E]
MSLVLPLVTRETARRRLGLMTRSHLLAHGVTDREIAAAVRRGELRRVRAGAYVRAADWAEVERTRRLPGLHALAVAEAVAPAGTPFGFDTAAWVWALPRPARRAGTPDPVHLVDPASRGGRRGDWVVHRSSLPPEEVTRRGAYPVTTAARTVVDVARSWSEVDAVAAADAALLRGLTTREELLEVLARHSTVAGTPAVRRVLQLADGRAESWLETCGRLAFAAGGLPPFVPQVELWLDGELLKVVDGWYAQAALAIEFDGQSKYVLATPADLREEKRVEDLLRSVGIRFVRVTYEMLTRGWAQLKARILRELAVGGPTTRVFGEQPREVGKVRGGVRAEDGWLWRAMDNVGGAAP